MSYEAGDLIELVSTGDNDVCIVALTSPSTESYWHCLVVESDAAWLPKGMLFTLPEVVLEQQGTPAFGVSVQDMEKVVELLEQLNNENEELSDLLSEVWSGVVNPVTEYRRSVEAALNA